ncbi:hypothetical protein [Kitasatospora sp. NPDC005856]|uniref:hypothetical protein n=1 Tax=Kitasatospora sp. NPDC005856 TaxID=3154566 RepID=UPI003406DE72
MPVTPYGPWPTAEEQPHPPLVPRYVRGLPADEPPAATPTDHLAPVAGPVGHHPWSDDAQDPPTAELPAVTDAPGGQPPSVPPPVFVDASGRRQRRIRRLGAALAVPAGGYLVLLASTLLGGPTVNAPFLPVPQPPAPSAPSRAATPSAVPSAAPEAAAPPGAPPTVAPARQAGVAQGGDRNPQATGVPAEPAAGQTGVPVGTGSPAPGATSAAPPSAPPAAAATPGRGRPTVPPGNSGNKPVKP